MLQWASRVRPQRLQQQFAPQQHLASDPQASLAQHLQSRELLNQFPYVVVAHQSNQFVVDATRAQPPTSPPTQQPLTHYRQPCQQQAGHQRPHQPPDELRRTGEAMFAVAQAHQAANAECRIDQPRPDAMAREWLLVHIRLPDRQRHRRSQGRQRRPRQRTRRATAMRFGRQPARQRREGEDRVRARRRDRHLQA